MSASAIARPVLQNPPQSCPNSAAAIQARVASHQVRWAPALFMLVSRIVLFTFFQALIAVVYAVQGNPAAWDASVAWWPISVTLTNLTSILLLAVQTRREGIRVRDLYNGDRRRVGRDLLISLVLTVVFAPVVMLPNILIGNLLFGDVAQTLTMMFRPLPQWVILVCGVLFPLTIAFSELPTYFGYTRPRLEALAGRSGNAWLGVVLPIFFLAAQHCAFPLIFDARFLLWRLLMFLPFAAVTGLALRWRPSLLPYMMVVHGLLDSQLMLMVPVA